MKIRIIMEWDEVERAAIEYADKETFMETSYEFNLAREAFEAGCEFILKRINEK